jgi:glycosyltransferase involved in cell wall biosynthesis
MSYLEASRIEGGDIGTILVVASFQESILLFRGPLICALQKRGVTVHVAAPRLLPGSAVYETLKSMGVVPHNFVLQRAGTNPLSDLATFYSLFRLASRIRPDTVMSYTIKPVVFGTIAAWLAGIPNRYALITGLGHSFTGERTGMLERLTVLLYRLAISKADKVFFQNPDDQKMFYDRNILHANKNSIVVNGSGVDLSEFREAPLQIGGPRFLMIARLLGAKGVREYVAAARRLNVAAKFRLVGWIDENPGTISQTELDGWVSDGDIEFLGRLQDVRPAIADSTVYVLPSWYREGTPRTVLEAMAMGRPIITTEAPGCRETVIDGDNGFLVPVKSVDALAEAMQKFIDDPELAPRMGKRSREIAEDKYDVHKVNAVMLREMGIT